MIEFSVMDDSLTLKEIERFLKSVDTSGSFNMIDHCHDNFEHHFRKLIAVKQVLSIRKNGKLVGLCSWMIVDKDSKLDINKMTWAMPEDVCSGDIFYFDVCALSRPISMFRIRREIMNILTERNQLNLNKIFWFDMPHRRVFRTKFTGGKPCLTAG